MWIQLLFLACYPYLPIQERMDTLPPANAVIIKFITSAMGTKVGRGECWDLANAALHMAGARWDHQFNFGRTIADENAVIPGDIIQFTGVKLKHRENNQFITETMLQHTAVVYKVISPGVFDIAQQNTGGRAGKKVSLSRLTLHYKLKGKIEFFRPQT